MSKSQRRLSPAETWDALLRMVDHDAALERALGATEEERRRSEDDAFRPASEQGEALLVTKARPFLAAALRPGRSAKRVIDPKRSERPPEADEWFWIHWVESWIDSPSTPEGVARRADLAAAFEEAGYDASLLERWAKDIGESVTAAVDAKEMGRRTKSRRKR